MPRESGKGGAKRLSRYRTYLAKGLLPHKLLQLLASAGIVLQPYYFFSEEYRGTPALPAGADSPAPGFGEAGPGDAAAIAALNGAADGGEGIRSDFRKGDRCFVLRKEGAIVALTWCNTAEITFPPLRRSLQADEAYLYGMQTVYSHRGHDLAPYLRQKCIAFLNASGRRRCYSYTDLFNRPALRFKEKIGATILFKALYVGIKGLGGWNWVLKRFDAGPVPVDD